MGRSPTLVAVALMSLGGMIGVDAIRLLRKQRPYSLNINQVNFLLELKPKSYS